MEPLDAEHYIPNQVPADIRGKIHSGRRYHGRNCVGGRFSSGAWSARRDIRSGILYGCDDVLVSDYTRWRWDVTAGKRAFADESVLSCFRVEMGVDGKEE